jgi:hypothetical protein
MAGSYRHATTRDGKLRNWRTMSIATETGGDAWETIEEFYGMVWWLANQLELGADASAAEWVESARTFYREGLQYSPGVQPDGAEGRDDE